MQKITQNLLDWYSKNKRDLPWRKTKNPYYIWISEIMLQQTRVEVVKVYYERFIKRLPTLKDLSTIHEDELLKLWEGLGYYSRVRNMQKTAKILIDAGKNNLPNTKKELLNLPGIGKYTAGAILSIAFDKPSVAIDGNVYRVLGRYYAIGDSISKDSTYTIYEQRMHKILPKRQSGDFIQSFMDLGNEICTSKSPKCESCPLQKECKAKKSNQVGMYPVKDKQKEKKIEERSVFLLVYKDKVAIQKRKNTGLLASMYEFPNIQKTMSTIDIENALFDKNISYQSVLFIGEAKHVFSHVIWYMKGYIIELKKPLDNYCWVTKQQLKKKYSIPSAFSSYLDYFLKR